MGFGKIISGISLSSLMNEPVAARWLFVFMISQADRDGNIRANRESFRRSANMEREDYDDAISRLEAPDPLSASRVEEGRRIIPLDVPGWHVVNHAAYRNTRDDTERELYLKIYGANRRAIENGEKPPFPESLTSGQQKTVARNIAQQNATGATRATHTEAECRSQNADTDAEEEEDSAPAEVTPPPFSANALDSDPEPERLTHQMKLDQLKEYFDQLGVAPPQNRKGETDEGVLGKWLGACGGEDDRLIAILDELHGRGKLDGSWSYTWKMVQVWADDGPPAVGGNGTGGGRRDVYLGRAPEGGDIRDFEGGEC